MTNADIICVFFYPKKNGKSLMMDWKLQSGLAAAGGLIVLIVSAGYKSYRFSDLPSGVESGITFLIGSVLTAILAFMGGFDSWAKDLSGFFGEVDLTTTPTVETNDLSSVAKSVGDSMSSMKGWFQSDSSDEEMMVGIMPM
jgi:hypothetical protein